MTRCTTQKRAPLTRDRVLRAALELADEGGTAALTMQRIGRRLGVEAMSLYRHVRNKDDILDGIVDLVFAEVERPADRSNWRTVLRAQSISTRAALRRHPWAIALMESRMTPGPANLRTHEDTITVLLDAGCSAVMAIARLQPRRQLRARVRAPGGEPPVQQRRGVVSDDEECSPTCRRMSTRTCARRQGAARVRLRLRRRVRVWARPHPRCHRAGPAGSLIAGRPVKRVEPTAGPSLRGRTATTCWH